jgi:hypothetical protein
MTEICSVESTEPGEHKDHQKASQQKPIVEAGSASRRRKIKAKRTETEMEIETETEQISVIRCHFRVDGGRFFLRRLADPASTMGFCWLAF